ncbi:MAG TPA: HRDC domain-containing protein, partial [Candidatus Udaeobacter sp.]|nr:HRDC domain-containing protein [Candidatus Udaeobacter sp.]
VTLTKQVDVAGKAARSRIGAIACDELLFEQLRGLRRRLADERDVPAYVIFSDVTLREMARNYPTTPTEFRRIPGVGEQKLKDFADPFLSEIRAYLTTNERRTFTENGGPLRPPRPARLNDSQLETLRRFQRGETVDEIARARGFVRSTIYSHLLAAIECGKLVERDRFFTPPQEKEIAAAFRQVANGTLVDVSALLGGKYDTGLLRIFRETRNRRSRLNS